MEADTRLSTESTAAGKPSPMVTSVTSPATASRQLKASPLRRMSEIFLVVSTVMAVAAAFGPIWTVRLGLAVAITAAVVACASAWREIHTTRRAHAQAMLEATRSHGAALSEERTRNVAVVHTLKLRITDARRMIEKQRVTIARKQQQISSLRDDRAYLRGEVEYREKVISALAKRYASVKPSDRPRDGPDAESTTSRRVLAEQSPFGRNERY